MISNLYINDVPIECVNHAAVVYHVPATVLISVLKVENGRAGLAKRNSNGTYDYGPMQINSIWLDSLKKYGYSRELVQNDPCTNMWVGSWILSTRIAAQSNDLWRGIANYHSYTEAENIAYQYKVWGVYLNLMKTLSGPTPPASQIASNR
jgi:Transglycosylase SLT domain